MPRVPNPLGIEALRPLASGPIYVLLALLPVCILGCAVSLIIRFRRSRGLERQQLKWLAGATAAIGTLFFLSIAASLVTGQASQSSAASQPAWLTILYTIGLFSFMLIPVAVGIAILRYRLYDIDVIINRTLVYGSLTAVLALVYVAGVFGVGGVLRDITGEKSNDLVIAASTLAVAALFRPARSGIQSFIDRRFYRRKYNAVRTIETFSAKLIKDEVDLEALRADLLSIVHETMQPTQASLWLRSE